MAASPGTRLLVIEGYDALFSGCNDLGGKPGWPAAVRRAFEAMG